MNWPVSKSEWREIINPIKQSIKQEPIVSILFLVSLAFYASSFVYNNLQNGSVLFSLAWFYDAIILSWTNLLIFPILLLAVPWQGPIRDWESFKDFLKMHLYSPFLWIVGYLALRLAYKVILGFNEIIADLLKWLAS